MNVVHYEKSTIPYGGDFAGILENTSSPRGGILAEVIWGKNVIRRREKGGKCKTKSRKVERRRIKEKEKMRSKKGK
jgi:hypothetical protein